MQVQLAKADGGPSAQASEGLAPIAEAGMSDTNVDEAMGNGDDTAAATVDPVQAQVEDLQHAPQDSSALSSQAPLEGVPVAEEHKDAASWGLEQEDAALSSMGSVEPVAAEAEGGDVTGGEAVRSAEGLGPEAAMDTTHALGHAEEHANRPEADQPPTAPQVSGSSGLMLIS